MEKNALITGSGLRIGRAIAIKLANAGWNVALHYGTSVSEAEDLAAAIRDMGRKSTALQADLSDTQAVRNLIPQATKEIGNISCLINNASLFEPDTLQTVSEDSFQDHLSVNLLAPALLMQALAAQPLEQQGHVINIIDQRVTNLKPGFLSYTLSKSALWTLTQSAAMELAPRIRVNGIGPGPTLANKRQSAAQFKQQCEAVPLQYGPTDSEIADGVLFLVNAPSITGEMILMDGGEHLFTSGTVEE